ncbi:hypothetical protein BDZ85DRAFT_49732 [Elsinoe ampelina]|uniref:Uncharacterized protein n=1 Tax=Elsinoe ampelina TaxID=302913 RepID=A0A6A6GKW2_9PEZI|nr:hypothetical protein BDZ85DRAFT_49732 [Elsinoe ampelina]
MRLVQVCTCFEGPFVLVSLSSVLCHYPVMSMGLLNLVALLWQIACLLGFSLADPITSKSSRCSNNLRVVKQLKSSVSSPGQLLAERYEATEDPFQRVQCRRRLSSLQIRARHP